MNLLYSHIKKDLFYLSIKGFSIANRLSLEQGITYYNIFFDNKKDLRRFTKKDNYKVVAYLIEDCICPIIKVIDDCIILKRDNTLIQSNKECFYTLPIKNKFKKLYQIIK